MGRGGLLAKKRDFEAPLLFLFSWLSMPIYSQLGGVKFYLSYKKYQLLYYLFIEQLNHENTIINVEHILK